MQTESLLAESIAGLVRARAHHCCRLLFNRGRDAFVLSMKAAGFETLGDVLEV